MCSLKKWITLFVLTFLVQVIPAQSQFPAHLKHYHEYVNEAELAIVNEQYFEAQKYYKNAFRILPGFSSDRYNAMLLAQKDYDAELLQDCGAYFLERQVCPEFFQQFPGLDLEMISRSYKKKGPAFQRNMQFVWLIDSLYAHQLKVSENNRNDPKLIMQANIASFESFKKQIEGYGFPNEELIGVECSQDFQRVNMGNLLGMMTSFCRAQLLGMDTTLTNAVLKGQLKPEIYASLMNYLPLSPVVANPVYVINNEKYILFEKDLTHTQANAKRAEIGLCTIEEQILKIRFREKFPQSPFMLPLTNGIQVMPVMPDPILKEVLKQAVKYD
jgi:hypothetical protein